MTQCSDTVGPRSIITVLLIPLTSLLRLLRTCRVISVNPWPVRPNQDVDPPPECSVGTAVGLTHCCVTWPHPALAGPVTVPPATQFQHCMSSFFNRPEKICCISLFNPRLHSDLLCRLQRYNGSLITRYQWSVTDARFTGSHGISVLNNGLQWLKFVNSL